MRKSVKIALCVFLLVLTAACAAAAAYVVREKNSRVSLNPNVTLVTAPEQEDFEVHPEWTLPEPEVIDYGENLALGKKVTQNGSTQIYQCRNAVDGDRFTYWEGLQSSYPNVVTVDLGEPQSISGFGILLNPRQIWSARTQEVEVQLSEDGEEFTTLLPAQTVSFDPMTDNRCYLPLDGAAEGRYVRFVFTANSGARAGQAAELEIYKAK